MFTVLLLSGTCLGTALSSQNATSLMILFVLDGLTYDVFGHGDYDLLVMCGVSFASDFSNGVPEEICGF